jgi:WhiB family redox-sensing transcriptional regulator
MTTAILERDWRSLRGCLYADPDELMPESPDDCSAVIKYCYGCPVVGLCLDTALATGSRDGIWGGLSESQRASLHDERERTQGSYSARKLKLGSRKHLTIEDKLELADLRQASGRQKGSPFTSRQLYRLKIGELKVAGIDYRELIAVVQNWAISEGAAERLIWRATYEYREVLRLEALEIEADPLVAEVTEFDICLPTLFIVKAKPRLTTSEQRVLRLQKRARRNYLTATKYASSESGKAYWAQRAAEL